MAAPRCSERGARCSIGCGLLPHVLVRPFHAQAAQALPCHREGTLRAAHCAVHSCFAVQPTVRMDVPGRRLHGQSCTSGQSMCSCARANKDACVFCFPVAKSFAADVGTKGAAAARKDMKACILVTKKDIRIICVLTHILIQAHHMHLYHTTPNTAIYLYCAWRIHARYRTVFKLPAKLFQNAQVLRPKL